MPKNDNQASVRSAGIFLAGPGTFTVLVALWVGWAQPAFPHPSQAQSLTLAAVLPVLALATLGIWLAARANMTAEPFRRGGLARGIGIGLIAGLLTGGIVLALDRFSQFSAYAAGQLGVASLHVGFPASLLVYGAGAILVESIYRLIPLGLLYFLFGHVILKDRHAPLVFWILAVLVSAIEPASQSSVLEAGRPLFAVLVVLIFLVNLGEAALLRRCGWPAPIALRLALYGIWHVVGGLIFA